MTFLPKILSDLPRDILQNYILSSPVLSPTDLYHLQCSSKVLYTETTSCLHIQQKKVCELFISRISSTLPDTSFTKATLRRFKKILSTKFQSPDKKIIERDLLELRHAIQRALSGPDLATTKEAQSSITNLPFLFSNFFISLEEIQELFTKIQSNTLDIRAESTQFSLSKPTSLDPLKNLFALRWFVLLYRTSILSPPQLALMDKSLSLLSERHLLSTKDSSDFHKNQLFALIKEMYQELASEEIKQQFVNVFGSCLRKQPLMFCHEAFVLIKTNKLPLPFLLEVAKHYLAKNCSDKILELMEELIKSPEDALKILIDPLIQKADRAFLKKRCDEIDALPEEVRFKADFEFSLSNGIYSLFMSLKNHPSQAKAFHDYILDSRVKACVDSLSDLALTDSET